MVQVTISAVAKTPSLRGGFPLTVDVAQEATVGDVKAAIYAKFPKVRVCIHLGLKNGCRVPKNSAYEFENMVALA